MSSRLILLLLLFSSAFGAKAQDLPFHKGVNLTNWLQVGSAREINYRRYTQTDFAQIKSLGCDVIRLPINLHFMTDGAPDYQLDPIFLNILDEAVAWAEALDLHLILDNHTFDPSSNTDPNVGIILEKVWTQMAQHYKDQYENLYFEILNEPHGIDHSTWNDIQQAVVAAIRQVDTRHTLIIGGADWNNYQALEEMPVYQDDNLIYTFHFYDPFLFTHQGATWVGAPMDLLRNVPFPYAQNTMPGLPTELQGTWVNDAYNGYPASGNAAAVEALIDIAIRFRNERQVPLFCGEFGVYQANSQNDDRVRWYELVSDYLTANDIAWTMWDYHGGFGVFEPDSDGQFEHDLNLPLLAAVGLEQPAQTPAITRPDSNGLLIYDDYAGEDIQTASWTGGSLDFFDDSQPREGRYAIQWSNAGRYDAVAFDFLPNRDLSYLAANDYQLAFYARSDLAGHPFDIRFVDTQTDLPSDQAWRMGITITDAMLPRDGQWHLVQLPLKDFAEQGAWDGQWHNPVDAFDWSAIDRLEFVAERGDLPGYLQLDQIEIWSPLVPTVSIRQLATRLFPNPVTHTLHIEQAQPGPLQIRILDILGRQVASYYQEAQNISINLEQLATGTYFLQLRNQQQESAIQQLIKL